MTWTSFHYRGEVLRDVIVAADSRGDGILPMDVSGVAETFGDELTVLGALQLRWHTRLARRIERELSRQPLDLDDAVVSAWLATAEELPGIRAVLDRHRAEPLDPAMAQAMEKAAGHERRLLAAMAGRTGTSLGSRDPLAERTGAELEQRARSSYRPESPTTRGGPTRLGLLDRIRAAFAA